MWGCFSQACRASALVSSVQLCWPHLPVGWVRSKQLDPCKGGYHQLRWERVGAKALSVYACIPSHSPKRFWRSYSTKCLPATETHPACIIPTDGMWLPKLVFHAQSTSMITKRHLYFLPSQPVWSKDILVFHAQSTRRQSPIWWLQSSGWRMMNALHPIHLVWPSQLSLQHSIHKSVIYYM